MRAEKLFQNRFVLFVEEHFRIDYILYAFWTLFWTLNGLDKFFNGKSTPGTGGATRLIGWFGVNRDEKFIDYFSRLHLPPRAALSFLYFFAVLEIIVGIGFFLMFIRRHLHPTLNRMAFRVSMLIFLCFSVGDILFGDRMELWEHGTFMVLTMMTYQLYLTRTQEHADVVGRDSFSAADTNRDNCISTEEFEAFIEKLRKNVSTIS